VSFRLVVHPRMDGRRDMAVDEALAEACGRGESPPVVRLYGFLPPTLSLGRFQRAAGLLDEARLAADGIGLVRRPTGGHAVLHDLELTYAVAFSREDAEELAGSSRKRAVYEYIAAFLLDGLARLGVRGTVCTAQVGDPRNPDCFGAAGEYEIEGRSGRKLIGSAQMTTRSAVLQHGSIPIGNPGRRVFRYLRAEAPADFREPTCLLEETGRLVTFEEVREAFAAAARATIEARDDGLTPAEESRVDALLAERYDTDAWNLRC
jgi:lipoyl(octanoyl) transferase